jgi:hypothetical protein
MDRDFALAQEIFLCKLPRPTSITVIDRCSIASGDIIEESELIRVVFGDVACIISFNIISSPEHPIVLGSSWFELHNPKIDWKKREIKNSQDIPVLQSKAPYYNNAKVRTETDIDYLFTKLT